jgi:hypothetical protein
MPSYSLAKVSVTYWSSTGPGTSRKLLIRDNDFSGSINESLEIRQEKKQGCYPVEVPIQLSEQAETILQTYLNAHAELEAAKLKFANAKNAFAKSEGGKEIQKYLAPQPETLPEEEVVSEEDVQELRALVENVLDDTNSIIKCTKLVKGYNIGKVIMKLKNPIPFSLVESLTYKDYVWAHPYKTYNISVVTKDNTTSTVEFAKSGSMYPPYREEDYKEIMNASHRPMK